MYEEGEGEIEVGCSETEVWKGGWEKFLRLGSESRKLSDFSTSELLKLDMLLKTVWIESSESVRG